MTAIVSVVNTEVSSPAVLFRQIVDKTTATFNSVPLLFESVLLLNLTHGVAIHQPSDGLIPLSFVDRPSSIRPVCVAIPIMWFSGVCCVDSLKA